MSWLGPAFLALVAVVLLMQRRALARLQAHVLGGSILPGCVIAEAGFLLAIAAAMLWFSAR